jgi:hypothetical protein
MKIHKEYQELLVKLLVSDGYKEEVAKELAFHLADMNPDLRKLIDMFDQKNFTINDLYKVFTHIPYHIAGVKTLLFDKDHGKFHSPNAFCGNAGGEEMEHMRNLVRQLTDTELVKLVKAGGIEFVNEEVWKDRDQVETVVDEIDREVFYREYRKICEARKIANR